MEYRYHPEDGDADKLAEIKHRVVQGLDFEGNLPGSDSRKKDALADTIAQRTLEIAEILGLDPPDINFGIVENLPRRSSTVLRTINGISTIRFTVNYLRFHVDTLGIPLLAETSESLLSEDLAHELYHIRVGKKFPFAFKKSIEANDDPYKYSKDWGERAARLFSLFYISHRDKPNFLTAVGDFMAELAIKQKISFYKQHKDI